METYSYSVISIAQLLAMLFVLERGQRIGVGCGGHPEQWPWCSYQEWMGRRLRYVLTNQRACLGIFRNPALKTFQENHRRLIDETISQDKCRREPAWTESIAVGSKDFVGAIEEATVHRRRFETEDLGFDAWALRESA